MTTETLTQALLANTPAGFGRGRVLYIKSATSPISIIARNLQRKASSVTNIRNVGAGFKFIRDRGDEWQNLEITSALAQTIEIILSDDDVEIANAVSVTGTAVVAAQPSTTMTDTVDANTASGAEVVIAANSSRRRITIGVLSTSANPVRVSFTGGAGRGIEIAPGTQYTFETIAALTVRNDNTFGGAAVATWYAEEEA